MGVKINEVYKPLYTTKKRYTLITGGRGSGKSFGLVDFLVRLTFERGHGILFTRYTMVSAEISIIPEFKAAIERLGLSDHFHITTKDIINKLTGSFVWFRGIKASSNAQKANLKSLANITTFVVEEGEDFLDEQVFDKIDDSVRLKGMQNRVIWVQNSSDRFHFIYERFIKNHRTEIEVDGFKIPVSTHPDVTHIHTTYLDNAENLNESFLKKAEQSKEEALQIADDSKVTWYEYNYLGKWKERSEGAIITNWEVGEFNDSLPFVYGQDYGFSKDPTTLLKVALDKKNKLIYVDELYYKSKELGTSDIYELNSSLIHKPKALIIGDSQEQRLIMDLKVLGLNIIPCEKGPGSVLAGIRQLQDHKIIVTERSSNTIYEFNNYSWLDKKGEVPEDDNNHAIDPIRYSVRYLLRPPTVFV